MKAGAFLFVLGLLCSFSAIAQQGDPSGIVSQEDPGKPELQELYRKVIQSWIVQDAELGSEVRPQEVMDEVSRSDDPVDMGRMIIRVSPFRDIVPDEQFMPHYYAMHNRVSKNITAQLGGILTYETREQQMLVIQEAAGGIQNGERARPIGFGEISSEEKEILRLTHEVSNFDNALRIRDELDQLLVRGVLREFADLSEGDRELLADEIGFSDNNRAIELLMAQGIEIHTPSSRAVPPLGDD